MSMNIHRPLCSKRRGNYSFSFAVDPACQRDRYTGKGKPLSSKAAKKKHPVDYFDITNKIVNARKGLRILAFRRPCPVKCEADLTGVSEKLKKNHLCAFAVSRIIKLRCVWQ
jgi:hypothetical protein